MSPPRPSDLLELYLLGELPPADTAAVETWLRDDPAAPARLDAARATLAALDALLQPPPGADRFAARVALSLDAPPRSPWRLRGLFAWAAPLAAAACVLLAAWVIVRGPAPPEGPGDGGTVVVAPPPPASVPFIGPMKAPDVALAVAAGWQVRPTGTPVYHVEAPDRVRLELGELFVETVPAPDRPALTIDTPAGSATAAGERFYVAVHELPPPPGGKGGTVNRFMRVLVLAGAVTLTTALGSVSGQPGQVLTAEPGKAPVNHAVTANSDFAYDLYARLAADPNNKGKSMFFSPYSVSTALAMVAEGARGETAAEMGKTLRYPDAVRRVGDDAQLIPWNSALIHTGMASLQARFNAGTQEAPPAEKARLAELRKQLEAANKRANDIAQKGPFNEYDAAIRKSRALADEVNKLAAKYDRFELRVANALWGEKSYPFKQDYFNTVNKFYNTGGVFPTDFIGAPEEARGKINRWVEVQTKEKIKNLLPEGSVTPKTRLALVNAIYFKGEWAEVFDAKQTKDRKFTALDGKAEQVPMMNKHGMSSVHYAAFDADGKFFNTPLAVAIDDRDAKKHYPGKGGFELLEMPYKGDELSMVVVLPRDADGLAGLEKKLTAANVGAWTKQLKQRQVNVGMPKFKMTHTSRLNGPLQELGMKRAFTDPREANGANFDGMSQALSPDDKLYITLVIHKAFVELSEKGTEAAAATAVLMAVPTSVQVMVPFTPTFEADRPFAFLIRDRQTGSVLFLGRFGGLAPTE